MIYVVPADVGKPTAKLDKVKVRDGGCYWEKPVYETIKFTQEPKTGKINERIYHFILATGLSKFGLLGEVFIDFANYAVATKLSSVSLPLKTAKFEAVLHVSIERIQDSVDQRGIEEGENLKHNSQDRSLKTQLSNSDMDENIKTNSSEDGSFNKVISHIVELNGNRRASSGSDVTISSSESISELDTPQEHAVKNNNINEDCTNFLSSLGHASVPQKPTHDSSIVIYKEHQGSQSEWSGGSAPDVSTDDSSSSPRETLLIETSQNTSDILIEKLKSELAVLARQSEVSELELLTLRKNIVKESKRGQDLSRELASVKEERDAVKEEFEKLKSLQKRADEVKVRNKLQVDGGDPWALLEELRQELNHEKDLNVNLRLQLQKTQESNSQLILAVQDLDEMLEEKNREILGLSNKSAVSENANDLREINSKCDTDVDEDQKALEEIVKEHSDAKDAYVLEQKIMDLYGEIDIYRRDRDDLEMQMEQLALDYEILKQENHDISYKLEQSQVQEQLKMQYECSTSYATLNDLEGQIESLENDLKKQSKEFSDSLVTVSELENHVKNLEEDLEKQVQGFEADLEDLTRAKVEQEKRAILAEETLRKTRWQNANTAERLQEEFRGLYVQMVSTFDANEKLATKARTEANELCLEKNHLEEMLQQAKEELQSVRDFYEAKLLDLSSQIQSKLNQMEQMQSEIEYKSIEIENQRKQAVENDRLLSQEILMLRSEIGRLTTDNNVISELEKQKETFRAELEQMKASIKETEMLVERGITERDELKNIRTLLKMEAEKSLTELHTMRRLKDEAESIAGNLQSEVETLKTRYNELKHSLVEDELEKEKLRKQVFQLKGDLKTKEDALSCVEQNMKDDSGRSSKGYVNLMEKIRLLKGQIKLKEAALESSSNTFLEKEKDLQTKIKELEINLGMLNQNAARFRGNEFEKVADLALSDGMTEEAMFSAEDSSAKECTSERNGCPMTLKKCIGDISSENELKKSITDSRDQGNLSELLNEMASLKERNQSMEGELKDMQERYSEISLKFAEVEGERQQLVMRLRNIKNSKKKLATPP